jgi:hypothetical protein
MLEQQMGTGAPADTDDDDVEYKPFSKVPIERNDVMTPPGTTVKGFDAKQPSTTYEMFQEKCLGEACRPLNYPLFSPSEPARKPTSPPPGSTSRTTDPV